MSEAVFHGLNFERNTQTGQWRVKCTCGWSYTGTQAECYSYSSGHDLEDTPSDNDNEPEKT